MKRKPKSTPKGKRNKKSGKAGNYRNAGKKTRLKESGSHERRTDNKKSKKTDEPYSIRLNKYIADAGICSRREADVHIAGGAIMINGKIVTELGTKVLPTDKVQYGGETLKREKLQYFMLNKPKGFITTSKDPLDRRTVMVLMEKACKERIYPVGRLDKDTVGLLLFTNDGELAKKLTHPKHLIKKIYHVFLDRGISKKDLEAIENGIELEDGTIKPDKISWVSGENDKKQVGIELHSGRNRIVRRIFEHLGYKVVKLDRVFFAGLTKKDIPRGKFRRLDVKEVNLLKRL
jgi:23S rRNA pseudouridine2605 synthase